MCKRKNKPVRHIRSLLLFLTFILGFFVVSVASSLSYHTGAVTAEELFTVDFLEIYKEKYNQKAKELPDVVFIFFGEEVVNIYFTDLDHSLYAILKEGELVDLGNGKQENPNIEITTSYETVVALQNGEITLGNAVDKGLVSYSSESFVKEAKISIVLYAVDVYEVFG